MVAVRTNSPLLEGWEVCDNVGELKAVADKAIGKDIKLGVRWKGARIPADQLRKVLGTAAKFPKKETGYILYYNPVLKAWEIRCTTQMGSGGACEFRDTKPATPGYAEVGTIHTHPGMGAFWSCTDHKDQDGKYGIHCVLGLDGGIAARYKWTIFTPSYEYDVNWEDVAEPVELGKAYDPDEDWVKLIEEANKPKPLSGGGKPGSSWRGKFPRLGSLWDDTVGRYRSKREQRERLPEEKRSKGPTDGRLISLDELRDEMYGRKRALLDDMKATGRSRAEQLARDWNDYEDWRRRHADVYGEFPADRRFASGADEKENIGEGLSALFRLGMGMGLTVEDMLESSGAYDLMDVMPIDPDDKDTMADILRDSGYVVVEEHDMETMREILESEGYSIEAPEAHVAEIETDMPFGDLDGVKH